MLFRFGQKRKTTYSLKRKLTPYDTTQLVRGKVLHLSPLLYPLVERAAAASIFYVSPTGSDGNACTSTAAPCATINAALAKSAAGDTIKVALGTYQSTGDQVVLITKNTTLLGGWNSNFSSQTGMSVLDGENARRVLTIQYSLV